MQIFNHTIDLPTAREPWPLIPFGCVHEDDAGHHAELWAECIERIKALPPWGRTIGLGDYFTFARTTYRKFIRSYKEDENSQRELDVLCRERAEAFYKTHLQPIQDKLLGLAEGNHHWEFSDGTTDTQYLCQLAKVPYLGKGSGHNFALRDKTGGIGVLQALVHHGDWGGAAQTIGGDLNSVERKAGAWDADIYLFAHTHRKVGWKDPVYGWPKMQHGEAPLSIRERPRVYIRAGCFMRGYVSSCVTYVERKLLRPTDLGWVELTTRFKQPYRADKANSKGLSTHDGLRHDFIVTY